MIKTKIFLILFSCLLLAGVVLAPPVMASGLTTSSDTGNNQVQATNSGDARYLTTNLSDSLSETPANETLFKLPKGFARNLGTLITSVTSLLVAAVILLVFAQLVMGGFYWITSGGDKGKTDEARNRIVAAIIGLLLIAASYAILVILLKFLGFQSVSDAFNQITPLSTGSSVLQ